MTRLHYRIVVLVDKERVDALSSNHLNSSETCLRNAMKEGLMEHWDDEKEPLVAGDFNISVE